MINIGDVSKCAIMALKTYFHPKTKLDPYSLSNCFIWFGQTSSIRISNVEKNYKLKLLKCT